MPRTATARRPAGDVKREAILAAALALFGRYGYRRTSIDDIAREAGVAKGTVYLYVESKEALFDLVARYADAPRPFDPKPTLPWPTPPPEATLAYVRDRVTGSQVPPTLAKALAKQRVTDVRGELTAIVGELYDTVGANRRGIKLLDRSARDYPDLARVWFESARGGLIELLTTYLRDRARRKQLVAYPDVTVVARLLIETTVFWAVHRHWDPHPQTVDESVAKETVVRFIVGALTKE